MNLSLFNQLVERIKTEIPGFEVKYKNQSVRQKVIGYLVKFFNPTYFTAVTTTSYPIVWFPSVAYVEEDPERAFRTLAHEYIHLSDYHLWFDLLYTFPQCLGILGLLGVVWHPLLWAFLFLLPLPAPWRVYYELRGYTMSMAVNYWDGRGISSVSGAQIEDKFVKPLYYFMLPVRWLVHKLVVAKMKEITTDALIGASNQSNPYRVVYDLIQASKLPAANP